MAETNGFSPETIQAQGLTLEEYQRIVDMLGRPPNLVELGMIGVMWSEHCSYKSSKIYLQQLPTRGDRIVQGPGENAGVVDIGDGWCIVFKIESHNHPSFIEPYQGAATGVGGILRDIFTMGARPVAAMNSLRFGPLSDPSNRAIMSGVVKGIGDYGNSFGVPTIGGEVYFAECYSKNPLVNALALGIARKDQIFLARAEGLGNPVIYVGAKTGRDGIHGAVMASAEFDDEALEQRPTVQVGDPFLEKLLLEACLEAMKTGAVVGIQDMGAAGLTCSSCEMGSRGRAGIEMNLDAVPQREKGMSAYEIMLSESQERMLLVVRSGREREIIDIFKRWDLDAVVIGRVTNTGKVVVRQGEEVVADLPTELLTDEAPVYHRPLQAPTSDNDCIERLVGPVDLLFRGGSEGEDYSGLVRVVLTSPNIASRQWVFEQYDHMVRTNTVSMMGIDAAVIRVKETRLGIALTTDGNGRYCSLNPREGAKLAVAEAARNLACVGARPLAITNCLNFASPERPEVMWEFKETIEGMAEACHAFNTPVTGGNVSFYNETEGKGIYPTPVIGMVGLVEEADAVMTPWFKHEGDFVVLFGEGRADMGGTEIMNHLLKEVKGPVPSLDLAKERSVQALCVEAIQRSLIKSAHDCSDGGLVVSLAECCFSSYGRAPRGVEINAQFELENVHESWWPMIFLFSESPSRILASVDPADLARLQELAANRGVSLTTLGRVMGESLRISLNGDLIVDHPVADLERGWRSSLARVLG